MNSIQELLIQAGKKNDVIDKNTTKEKAIKQIETDRIVDKNVSLIKVRDAILGEGKILEENLEIGYYLTTIRVNSSAAILIAFVSEGIVEIAAYAEEGLIKQHLARKAIDILKTRWESLYN